MYTSNTLLSMILVSSYANKVYNQLFGSPYNKWYVGSIKEVNKRRTKSENVTAEFNDAKYGLTFGHFCASQETYCMGQTSSGYSCLRSSKTRQRPQPPRQVQHHRRHRASRLIAWTSRCPERAWMCWKISIPTPPHPAKPQLHS